MKTFSHKNKYILYYMITIKPLLNCPPPFMYLSLIDEKLFKKIKNDKINKIMKKYM